MQPLSPSSLEHISPSLLTPLLDKNAQNETEALITPILHADDQKQNGSLRTSIELQTLSSSEQEQEINPNSQALDEKAQKFLTALGILLNDARLNHELLLQLLKVELNPYRSSLRWAALDSTLERLLQSPMIGRRALTPPAETLPSNARVWLQGRSIPLYDKVTLKSTLLARNMLRGIELTTFQAIHYFFYGLLSYHLYQLMDTGQDDFSQVWEALTQVKDNGLVNLVQALARLPVSQLKTLLGLLPLPTALLMVNGLVRSSIWDEKTVDKKLLGTQLYQTRNIFYTEFWQWLPFLPISSRIQSLEWALRWQGPLSQKDKWRIFRHLQDLALHSDKHIQRSAMQSLAKILHSFHAHELKILAEAGIAPEVLQGALAMKQLSLQTLQQLVQFDVEENSIARMKQYMNQSVRVLYAHYLLWWAGYSRNKKVSVFFPILKAIKLAIEINLLINLIKVIQEALNCPKQPDFVFGDGFVQQWAGDFTPQCFTARLRLFRTLNPQESVDALIEELQNYHLAGLTTLNLFRKGLTINETFKLINAIIEREAQLTSLDLSYNQLTNIPSNTFTDLLELQLLNLQFNQLTAISINAFSGLSHLQSLDLRFNQLTAIPMNSFSGLSQLKSLNLLGNGLTEISPNAFFGLSQLQSLDLLDNELTEITSDVFSGLLQLKSLYLGNNGFTEIPLNAFSILSQLEYLFLGNNKFTMISSSSFSGLLQLKSLNLESNGFTAIPENAFSGLRQLQILYLNSNRLTTIPSNAFSELMQLQKLYLNSNYLTNIPSNAFSELTRLQTLDLADNELTTLPTNSFFGLSQLQLLYLGGNGLSEIPINAFSELPKLQWLDLRDNKFTEIHSNAFIGLTQLKSLNLENNELKVIPSNAFDGLTQLESLDLEFNQLTEIPPNAFAELLQLKSLYLGGNALIAISLNTLSDLSHLQWLDLGNNRLTAISKNVFSKLSNLQWLGLRDNGLTAIPENAFAGLSQLRSLDLGGNRFISLLGNTFSELSQLQSLYLGRNRLTATSSNVFAESPQLKVLDLSNNSLTDLCSRTFMDLPKLSALNLNGNNISRIEKDAFVQVHFQKGTLYLNHQYLNDEAIYNLSLCLPSGITSLYLGSNKITQSGIETLASILPCTEITTLDLSNNPVNTSTLNLQTQANALRQLCEAQRCQDVWSDQTCEAKRPETLSSVQIKRNNLNLTKLSETTLLRKPWTWFKDLMNKTFDMACSALGSYAQEVVSNCPSYFDVQGKEKIAARQLLQSHWIHSPDTLFSPKRKINQPKPNHLARLYVPRP